MTNFFIPPVVADELLEQRRQREAEAFKALRDENHWQWVQEFNHDLKAVDHRLQLVWCPDPAPVEAAAAGAQPGRWNVVRHNEGAPLSVIPLVGESGEYREPGSWVFDMLKRADLWNSSVTHDRRRRAREIVAARERRESLETEERQARMLESWKAVSRTFVSMDRSSPWAQNMAGLRRTRGNRK